MAEAHRRGKREVILRDDEPVSAFVRSVAPGEEPRAVQLRQANLVRGAGAGKTVTAKRLSDRTGIPVVHPGGWLHSANGRMDARTHDRRIAATVAGRTWMVDEALLRTLGLQLAASDLTIFMETATHVRIWRCLRRARDRRLEGVSLGALSEAKTVLWTMLFPLLLATFFQLAFSNLTTGEKLQKINVAVVDNEAWRENGNCRQVSR